MTSRLETWARKHVKNLPSARYHGSIIMTTMYLAVVVVQAIAHHDLHEHEGESLSDVWMISIPVFVGLVALLSQKAKAWQVLLVPIPMGMASMVLAAYVFGHSAHGVQSVALIAAVYASVHFTARAAVPMSLLCGISYLCVVLQNPDTGAGMREAAFGAAVMLSVQLFLPHYVDLSDKLTSLLEDLALRDPLTRLLNRSGFSKAVEIDADSHGESVGCMVIDVDKFKQVNDTLGHEAGDKVLVAVAELISSNVRPGDIVSRFGGDEIVVFLPGCSESVLCMRAEQIVDAASEMLIEHDGSEFAVTLSIGAVVGPSGEDTDKLFRSADEAMYKAKKKERNSYVIL